jgi:hypothetical protein
VIADQNNKVGYNNTDHEDARIFFSSMDSYAEGLANSKKGIIFYNEGFIFGMLGDPSVLAESELKEFLEKNKVDGVELKYKSQNQVAVDKKKKVDVFKFSAFHKFNVSTVTSFLNRSGYVKI